ncbi:MAG: anion permease [Rhodobacterales bacterium]|nr:anion permease [Rhodobacterales bacterium]
MTAAQIGVLGILGGTMALFLWGRFRHDVVALMSLMACVIGGLVPTADAFAGFGHPAVITVACVLILSQGLQSSGTVDWLARTVLPQKAGRLVSLSALIGLGAFLSGFMNNVGAMALLMPVAIRMAGQIGLAPGQVLMPLAFSTILGGMTTLIGTPPNLIVSGFRDKASGSPFEMFDFAPVGVAVALAGVAFIVAFGWRLVPARRALSGGEFETGSYLTEIRVPEGSKAVGLTLRAFEREIEDSGAQVIALVSNEVRITAPHGGRQINADDVLVLEADLETVGKALAVFGIKLEEQGSSSENKAAKPSREQAEKSASDSAEQRTDKARRDEDIVLRELAVLPGSSIVGLSATDMHLRSRYGLNLLAVSRQGRRPRARLRTLRVKAGDLLLMQGPIEVIADFISETGCVPLGERDLRLPDGRKAVLAGLIMLGSIGLVAFGFLPAAAAFTLGVTATMLTRTLPLQQVYRAIDWPVIVLLAALIPVAEAMQTTGAADVVSRFLVETFAQDNPVMALAVVLVTTMFLSDVMNNAATAAVLCPIAISIAAALGVNPDSFLMAVAIGASCAFLTPIGHQNNTLILGPGGFGFGDYWRMGLPLEIVVTVVSLPLLLIIWPL